MSVDLEKLLQDDGASWRASIDDSVARGTVTVRALDQRRSRPVLLTLIAAVVVVLIPIGTVWIVGHQRTTQHDAQPSPSGSLTTDPNEFTSGPLAARYTDGTLTLDPPDPTAIPSINAQEAYSAYLKNGVDPAKAHYPTADVRLAVYTDNGYGTEDSNGKITPKYLNRLVWAVMFNNVPISQDTGSGGARLRGESPRTEPPRITPGLVMTLIDAQSGKSLLGYTGAAVTAKTIPSTAGSSKSPSSGSELTVPYIPKAALDNSFTKFFVPDAASIKSAKPVDQVLAAHWSKSSSKRSDWPSVLATRLVLVKDSGTINNNRVEWLVIYEPSDKPIPILGGPAPANRTRPPTYETWHFGQFDPHTGAWLGGGIL